MLISYSQKFIFIHNYKTGGGSISTALGRYKSLPPEPFYRRVLRRIGIPGRPYFNLHITAQELREKIDKHIFCSCFKFAFVRNPWEREVSYYHFIMQRPLHPDHWRVKKMSGFEEFVQWRVLQKPRLQKEFVTDTDGNVIVDFIGRFERLNEDFREICGRIGVQSDLPNLNQSQHLHYRLYYTERSGRLIEKAFKEDVDFFSYKF